MRLRNVCVVGSAVWLAALMLPATVSAADNGVRLLEAMRDGDRTTVR
jgi:hypothetical protein